MLAMYATVCNGGTTKLVPPPPTIPRPSPHSRASPARVSESESEPNPRLADAQVMGKRSMSVKPPPGIEELTIDRVLQRQKQIDIGKATKGYFNYIFTVPKKERDSVRSRYPELGDKEFPQTPHIGSLISKRKWDFHLKEWRRSLHLWDPVTLDHPRPTHGLLYGASGYAQGPY